ncbi:diaminobutyrate acetyltransferase [Paenibacillus abyssi]|uniref:L-2,4-diaminobutyric acid acetyltransferase n=1 Tax=Paenibacillus abyssi TaxID=1340531 RepID=A0A917CTN4_9BACL|nr:diaminobutyrate acetyltransferase [Paenibacillus abyssi]GGF96529.1 L-2,4-diaminobutyric acid acetyltransferase [Paenibacillus abyssi]
MQQEQTITLRPPDKKDGAAVWELISSAGTLDLNSAYCYLMFCNLFQDTCVIAEEKGQTVGFVSAFFPPDRENSLFVWQVAVDPEVRGRGLGKAMLNELLSRHGAQRIVFMEATVSPSNEASRRLFQSVAAAHSCPLEVIHEEGYPAGLFPSGHTHEDEPLLRIGPFHKNNT